MITEKNATKNFDYTTIADQLRTVSLSNDSHPACVIKTIDGIPNFPLTAKEVKEQRGAQSASEVYNVNRFSFSASHSVIILVLLSFNLKAILQVLIYKALYDKSYLGSKTTMTSGEWTCLISYATAPLTCLERGGSEKFKMKIYVSSGIRTHTPPVHDRKVAAP